MRREPAKFLADVVLHGEWCISFLEERSEAEYIEDELLRSAVERKLFIVGEAVVQLQHLQTSEDLQWPDSKQIVGFRNLLAHGYFALDHRRVYAIAKLDLPELIIWAKQLLSASDPGI